MNDGALNIVEGIVNPNRRKHLVAVIAGLGMARTGLANETNSSNAESGTSQTTNAGFGGTVSIRRAIGKGFIKRLGTAIVASEGIQLTPGDQIETGSDGEIILEMIDGRLAVRPDSQLTLQIDGIRENQTTRKKPVMVALWSGAIRYVTVASAQLQNNPSNHPRFDTRIATIGIRGTDLDLVVQSESFREADRELSAGAYLLVTEGAAQMISKLTLESVDVAAGGQAVALEPPLRPRAFGQAPLPAVSLLAQPIVGIFGRRSLDVNLR